MTNISRQTVTQLCLVITVITVWNPNSDLWGLCPLLEGVGRCPPQLEQLRTSPLSALKPNPLKQGANQLCWGFTRAQDLAVPKLSALQKHTHMHATRSVPTAKQQGRRPYQAMSPGSRLGQIEVSGPIKTLQDKGNKLSHPQIAVLTTVGLDDFPCQIPSSFLLL